MADLKNPPSAPRIHLPRSIFDGAPERNIGQDVQRAPLRHVPDPLLISTLVDSGCPVWAAHEVTLDASGRSRFLALQHWCLVQDAAEGDIPAIGELDRRRQAWVELRREQRVTDNPHGSVGLGDR